MKKTNNSDKGILYVVSGPSGAGKSSIISMLLERCSSLEFSVSYTTRKRREGEQNGKDYFFVTKEKFEDMRRRGEFLEWAEVHGNFYGTSKRFVNEGLKEGKQLLLDIDVQGAMNVKKLFPEGIYIFITPPSLEALKARLIKRGTESDAQIARRLKDAKWELSHIKEFDYIVMNEDLDTAVEDIYTIVRAEGLKVHRNMDKIRKALGYDI